MLAHIIVDSWCSAFISSSDTVLRRAQQLDVLWLKWLNKGFVELCGYPHKGNKFSVVAKCEIIIVVTESREELEQNKCFRRVTA